MNKLTKGQKLQLAYRQHFEPYAEHFQIAVTLTLKQYAKITVKRFENYGEDCYSYMHKLDDERLQSTCRYFNKLLESAFYGNLCKNKNKRNWAQPLIITAVEGRNNNKHTHLHLAIGNIPKDCLDSSRNIITNAWTKCDFANKQIHITDITHTSGWLSYITKEVGYTDNNAFEICSSVIPQCIQTSICT